LRKGRNGHGHRTKVRNNITAKGKRYHSEEVHKDASVKENGGKATLKEGRFPLRWKGDSERSKCG